MAALTVDDVSDDGEAENAVDRDGEEPDGSDPTLHLTQSLQLSCTVAYGGIRGGRHEASVASRPLTSFTRARSHL